MPINITMPALSPTMEEGTLAKWHVKEGDSVSSGDVIAEIETDKATMEVEAVDEGTIGKILVSEGSENVKVNAVIAVLLEEGESTSDIGDAAPAPQAKAPKEESKAEESKADQKPKDDPKAPSSSADAKPAPEPLPAPTSGGKRVFASPLARRLAKDAGIDLSAVPARVPRARGQGRHREGQKGWRFRQARRCARRRCSAGRRHGQEPGSRHVRGGHLRHRAQ